MKRWLCLFLLFALPIFSQEEKKQEGETVTCSPLETKEELVETEHKIILDGKEISYTAQVGTLAITNEKDAPTANLSFISYLKKGEDPSKRPITFCFNGGPGSSAIWLHMGAFGPKKISLSEEGYGIPPFSYEDNPYCLLDLTDLVFIDPVSTGYSCAIKQEETKQFHGVEEDIKSIASFIRLFVTKYGRWDSPKFIAGESYGTTRAAGLAEHLHEDYHIYLNGLVLISSALNFQTFHFDEGNDLPYLLILPSYTATAWYYNKLPLDLQGDFFTALEKAKEFSEKVYSVALMKGENLSQLEKEEIAEHLSYFTGLNPTYIKQNNLRVPIQRFVKELLRKQEKIVGRFDSRYIGVESDVAGESFTYDPSVEAIAGAFTSAFQSYLWNDLNWKDTKRYRVLANVWPWDQGTKFKNKYLNVISSLRETMIRNPHLYVFVASGYYDLATPFYASEYTYSHLGLEDPIKENIDEKIYPAGHMMYLHEPSAKKLKKDLKEYYTKAIPFKTPKANSIETKPIPLRRR